MMTNLLDDNLEVRYASPVKAGVIAGIVVVGLYLVWQIFQGYYHLTRSFPLLKALDADTLVFLSTIIIPVAIAMVYITIVGHKDSIYSNMLVTGIISAEMGYFTYWGCEIANGHRNYGFGDYIFNFLVGHLYIIAIVVFAFIVWLFVGPYRAYKDFRKEQRLRDFKNNPNG